MGSTKKHKKDHKHRKHKRSSPSPEDRAERDSPEEKKRRHRDPEPRSSKQSKTQHKKSSRRNDERDSKPGLPKRQRNAPDDVYKANGKAVEDSLLKKEAEASESANGEGASLSIEDTNKLRLKLGLKPLNVADGTSTDNVEGKKLDFVHAPAEDLWAKKKQEEMREKLKAIRQKRNMNKKMGKIKTLGEHDEDENDAGAWVERSRNIEEKKQLAQKREKEMAAMDAEFGIGGLVEKEFQDTKTKYTSKDLEGLNVKHSLEMFKEGNSVVLTLEDKKILDSDDEDILVSSNLLDAEKTKKSLENKAKGTAYKAYEEESVDELGFFKSKSLLSKYDEEIDGVKKDKFTIGSHGKIDVTWEQQKLQMKKEIQAKGVSLAMPDLKLASEYLTEEEMTKFKKRKKRVRKVRKRETFKADDLLPLPGTSSSSDLGSRSGIQPGNIPGWDEGMEVAKVDDTSITSTTLMTKNRSVIVDEDDAGNELQKALDKARKAKQKKTAAEDAGAAKVAQQMEVLSTVTLENPAANYSATISLNSTDEFCRQLGATTELNSIREEPMEEEEIQNDVDMNDENREEESSGWSFVHAETPKPTQSNNKEDPHAPIEAEPLATGGLAGALKLAGRKGYLVEEKAKGIVTVTNLNSKLLSKNYSIEDKNAVDHLDKYAHEKYSKERNRHDRGIVTEFEEKKNYKPSVKIEYVDEAGRMMNPKEAFRKLSHRFHGKGSGKMKLEKRQKKRGEEDMMLHMSSTDTPLNTVAMMKDKLRNEASPYIVLSGAGKTLQAGGPGLMSKK